MQNHDHTDQASDIEKYDLAQHIRDLDEIGLTIVPPAKLGLTINYFEQLRDAILRVASERTGVMFDLDKNPTAVFNGRPDEIGHLIVSHLIHEDQLFEPVVSNPVKRVLMTHLLGENHRLAVSDGWVKWQTPDSWEGEATTGFHADQSVVPPPWNWKLPHIANMNWTLTDYTKENGALAYVPGSHLEGRLPELGEALPLSVPVEAPMGSLVLFSGCLWHGAFRKNTPGLRVTLLGQHCRPYMSPFQDFKGRVSEETILASQDPGYLRSLLREGEEQLRIDPVPSTRAV